jgi:hypothetical protein
MPHLITQKNNFQINARKFQIGKFQAYQIILLEIIFLSITRSIDILKFDNC